MYRNVYKVTINNIEIKRYEPTLQALSVFFSNIYIQDLPLYIYIVAFFFYRLFPIAIFAGVRLLL